MRLALAEAARVGALGDVPVGAVILFDGRVIGRAGNTREVQRDPLGHAELLVLRQAASALSCWRLRGCTLICTLEPCPMCAGAMVNARIDHLVFGARDPRAGAAGTLLNLLDDPRLNHRVKVTGGVMASPCATLLRSFFAARRAQDA